MLRKSAARPFHAKPPAEFDRFWLRSVAPGVRFWHGPADSRPSFGQGRPSFCALPRRLASGRPGSKANSMTALWVIVLCGRFRSLRHLATASVMKADAGNPRMQEIAAAVREGAQAYLKRQFYDDRCGRHRDLCAAGLLPRHAGGGGLCHRRGAVGAAGFIGMNVSVRANCAPRSRDDVAGGRTNSPSRPAPSPACWWRVWRARRLYFAYLTHYMDRGQQPHRGRTLVALGFNAADFDLCASRRHLHQGRRRRRRSRRQVEAGIPGRSAQPGHHRRQRRRQCRHCAGMAADLFETYAVTAVAAPWCSPRSSLRPRHCS